MLLIFSVTYTDGQQSCGSLLLDRSGIPVRARRPARDVGFNSAARVCTAGGRFTAAEFSRIRNKTFDSSVDADAITDRPALGRNGLFFLPRNAVRLARLVSGFQPSALIALNPPTSCCHVVLKLPDIFISYL